jgi:hypothetical protein
VWRERHDGEKLREKTIEFIKRAHAGQVDKAGQPYHLHPMAVAELLPPDSDEDEYLAALLHDVLEDTEITETDLCDLGYSEKTIGIVKSCHIWTGSGRLLRRAMKALFASNWLTIFITATRIGSRNCRRSSVLSLSGTSDPYGL